MSWPKFDSLVGAALAGLLIGTTCYLAAMQAAVPEALWAADGAALGYYFRGRVEQPK